jgi:hypothetical protein
VNIAELAALEAAATPGPWKARRQAENYTSIITPGCTLADVNLWSHGYPGSDTENDANAVLIAALRNAAPDLIAAARERDTLAGQVAALRKALSALSAATFSHNLVLPGIGRSPLDILADSTLGQVIVPRLATICHCGQYVSDPSGDAGCGNCGADEAPDDAR